MVEHVVIDLLLNVENFVWNMARVVTEFVIAKMDGLEKVALRRWQMVEMVCDFFDGMTKHQMERVWCTLPHWLEKGKWEVKVDLQYQQLEEFR